MVPTLQRFLSANDYDPQGDAGLFRGRRPTERRLARMPLNTFRDVLLAQLEQADIAHLAVSGPLGPEVEIETPAGHRVIVMFDREGDLLSVEIEGEDTEEG